MRRRHTEGSRAELLGLGWALGLAFFTACYFALYLAAVPSSTAAASALLVAAGGVALTVRLVGLARAGEAAPEDTGSPALALGGLGLVALQVALAAWMAVRSPLASWDAWSFWALKARMFALGGPRPGYYHDAVTLYTHPDYPLNLPLAEAALFRLPGHAGLQLAALIGPACLAALLLLYYAGLSRLYGRAAAALTTMALAAIPALITQAAGGDADVPLALYLGGASLYLLLWWRLRCPLDAVLAGLLAGGAIWTKKEGLAAAALIIAALVLGEALRRHVPARERLRLAIGVAGAALVIPLPWLIFTHLVHPLGRDFLPLTPAVFVARVGRLPHIVASFALQMLDFANWSLLWLVLAGVLLLGARRLSPCGRGLLLLLAGQLAVYALAFVFSDWQPYTAHVQTSLDRLLAQATPLALLILVEAVRALRTRAATSVARLSLRDEAA